MSNIDNIMSKINKLDFLSARNPSVGLRRKFVEEFLHEFRTVASVCRDLATTLERCY